MGLLRNIGNTNRSALSPRIKMRGAAERSISDKSQTASILMAYILKFSLTEVKIVCKMGSFIHVLKCISAKIAKIIIIESKTQSGLVYTTTILE